MSAWTIDELHRVGDATELQLASRRPDGTLRPYTTMWVVRTGDDLYVRSAGGTDRPWYRHALASRRGRIRDRGIERDVDFGDADTAINDAIDATYHAKYDRYGTGPRQPRHRPRGARRHDPAHPPAHRWLSSSLCKTMTAHSQCRPSLPTTNAKVAELQQRGVVHFHSIIRLDAPRR